MQSYNDKTILGPTIIWNKNMSMLPSIYALCEIQWSYFTHYQNRQIDPKRTRNYQAMSNILCNLVDENPYLFCTKLILLWSFNHPYFFPVTKKEPNNIQKKN